MTGPDKEKSPGLTEGKERVLEADLQHVWHPMTQHASLRERPPLVVASAHGSTLVDADGHEYLDGMAGLWCVNVGYGREEIAEAAFRQMVSLPYYPHTAVNAPAAEFAGMLSELAGAGLEYVYYVNSGTEGNEAAFKLARQYHKQTGQPGRYKIIGRYYGYHGTSMATLAAGGLSDRRVQFEPLPQGYLHAPAPYCYRCPFGLTYPSCGVTCANYIEHMIEAEGPETVAAVVMEPIQSAAGALVPPEEYLPMVAKICKQHGVLLIIDEVINGFGRTGKWFAFQHHDVSPDMVVVAKGITSAYLPMGALLTTREIFDAFLGTEPEKRHAVQVNTYGGHPVAAAAGIANLRIMQREGLADRAEVVGGELMAGLRGLLDLPIVGDVRGKGLLLAVELVTDKESRRPAPAAVVSRVAAECLRGGVLVGKSAPTGRGLGNCIVLSPPLVLTSEEARRIVETLRAAIVDALTL